MRCQSMLSISSLFALAAIFIKAEGSLPTAFPTNGAEPTSRVASGETQAQNLVRSRGKAGAMPDIMLEVLKAKNKATIGAEQTLVSQVIATLSTGSGHLDGPSLFGLSFGITVALGFACMGYVLCTRGPSKSNFFAYHEHNDVGGMQPFQAKGGKGKGKGKFKGGGEEGAGMKGEGKGETGMIDEGQLEGKGKGGKEPAMMEPPGGGETKGKGKPMGKEGGQMKVTQASGKPMDKGKGEDKGKDKDKGKPGKGHPALVSPPPAAPAAPAATAAPAGVADEVCTPREPEPGHMLALFVTVKTAHNMPSVNTFGGCDPFVEVRCVNGDPSALGGDVKTQPGEGSFGKTNYVRGESNPAWNTTFTIPKCNYENDSFVNIILWDYNMTTNTEIGYQHVAMGELLGGMKFDASLAELPKKDFVARDFHSLLETPAPSFHPGVDLAFAYCEVHRFRFEILNCQNLPKVDSSLDVFIEIRLCKEDPRNQKYEESGKDCLWTASSYTMANNSNPTFNQTLEGLCPADPSTWFQISIVDSNKLKNTPLGHVTIPMKGLCGQRSGMQELTLTPGKLPNYSEPEGLSASTIKFKMFHDLAVCQAFATTSAPESEPSGLSAFVPPSPLSLFGQSA